MRGIRGLAAAAAAALIGVAYAQGGSTPPQPYSSTAGRELSPDLIAYAAFQSDLSDLSTMRLSSPGDVDAALDLAARHDRDALVRGWLSYAADVAAQSPEFVASVRGAERRYGRNTITRITSNRSFVRQLPGSADATRLVLAALAADAVRAASVAQRHSSFAYSLQAQPWGGAVAGEPAQRVARIRALGRPGGFAPAISDASAARLAASAAANQASDAGFGGRMFWDAVFVGPPAPAPSPPSPQWRAEENRPETLDAILSVAALRVLGAQQTQASAIAYFLRDPSAVGCVQMARLQFYQCVSATRYVYEGEYCLAQHALRDMAMCISAPIRKDETYMTAFAAPEAPVDFAVAVVDAAAADAAQAEAAPAPELAGAEEAVEPAAASLPGTAEAPTASPVVEVQPLPAIAAVAATPVATPAVAAPAAPSFADMGAGELFARADELDEQGQAAEARAARRALIARFPDSPLALLAAQRLAGAR